ncbi:MAG: FCD domain-containing protein [Firmicutes bacterium]|nr:FCD domain-containing protein [Bacillota bacterium]MCL5039824.1 FCD domain-containing protein [Bacillota bacterium]
MSLRWEEEELQALRIISTSNEPVGSWRLAEALTKAGFPTSEATAGRILKDLDYKGLTQKMGYKGRLLSEKGWGRLRSLEREKQRRSTGEEFLHLLRAHGPEELVELLVARRAIERETARLAAGRISPAEVASLAEIVARHERHLRDGVLSASDDADFHRRIAEGSRNRVLAAALDLIRHDDELTPALEYIRREMKGTVASDHARILAAISAGDPVGAEEAMVNHIDNVIRDVRRFWNKNPGEAETPPAGTTPATK